MLLTPSTRIVILKLNKFCIIQTLKKTSSSQPAQTVILEKSYEEPVIFIRDKEVDLIGPPDPISNLRPVIRKRLLRETAVEQKLREFQDATQAWNHEFWAKHNTNFAKEKQNYIERNQVLGEEKRQLTADEMSDFYKDFLNKNWRSHVQYNFAWYKRNFIMLFLALRVNVEKNLVKLL